MGGCSIDAYGVPLTQETIDAAKSADAVLMGSIGGNTSTSPWYKLEPSKRPEAGLLGIKNTSEKIWSVKFPDESVRDVPPGNGFPVWPGLEIDFGGGVQAKI